MDRTALCGVIGILCAVYVMSRCKMTRYLQQTDQTEEERGRQLVLLSVHLLTGMLLPLTVLTLVKGELPSRVTAFMTFASGGVFHYILISRRLRDQEQRRERYESIVATADDRQRALYARRPKP